MTHISALFDVAAEACDLILSCSQALFSGVFELAWDVLLGRVARLRVFARALAETTRVRLWRVLYLRLQFFEEVDVCLCDWYQSV